MIFVCRFRVVAVVAYPCVASVEPRDRWLVEQPEALGVWRPVEQGEVVEVGLVAEGCHHNVVAANGNLAVTTPRG
jgi:hypothetical protein